MEQPRHYQTRFAAICLGATRKLARHGLVVTCCIEEMWVWARRHVNHHELLGFKILVVDAKEQRLDGWVAGDGVALPGHRASRVPGVVLSR